MSSSNVLSPVIEKNTFWLTRIAFLRSLAFIYCNFCQFLLCLVLTWLNTLATAFLVAVQQNKQLIGRNGLLPAQLYLKQLRERLAAQNEATDAVSLLTVAPTVLWFVDPLKIDFYLDLLAYSGLAISFVVLVTGAANMVAMILLWIIYHSIVNVGQRWYSFGWESQLLETGFLAIWLCPVFTWKQLPESTPPPWLVIYGLRWLIFRIMIGAGLIKLRGDKCWRDLTCMNYHYETQPIPNPNSYFMHQEPEFIHKAETMGNHIVELLCPFLLWFNRPCILAGGLIQIFFQIVLIISGNLSFLNWLTILPSIACLDDKFLSSFFPHSTLVKVAELQKLTPVGWNYANSFRFVTHVGLAGMIAYLSIPVIENLISSRQMMNTSFEPLRLVNTYGAFGSITKHRTEIIVQGTHGDPKELEAVWKEYHFKGKPGDITKRPPFFSPYHYRLDWLMWFAAFQSYQQNPWLIHLVAKLLKNDQSISLLLEYNPFLDDPDGPPKFIRLLHYDYKYTKIGSPEAKKGEWWSRKLKGNYLPAVDYETLLPILRRLHWVDESGENDDAHEI